MKKKSNANVARLVAQATGLIAQGRADAAEAICRAILDSAKGNVQARHMLAMVCLARGDCHEAQVHALAGLETDGRNENLLVLLAEAQRLDGKTDLSIQTLRRLLSVNPRQTEALNNLGGLLIEQQRYDEAIAIFERLCDSGQAGAMAENNLGTALFATGRYEEALIHYGKSADLAPGLFEAQINTANTLAECGRIVEARRAYLQCMGQFPAQPQGFRRFADMCYRQGFAGEALVHYTRALELAPDDPGTELSIGRVLHDLGRAEEARTHLSRAASHAPTRADIAISLASVLADLNQMAAAREQATTAKHLIDPASEQACDLAEVFLAINENSAAEEILRNYIDRNPDAADRGILLLAKFVEGQLPADTTTKFVRRYYASRAEAWDAMEHNRPAELVANRFLETMRGSRTSTILDLGCGTGRVGELIANHVEAIDGVDISPQMLARAAAKAVYRTLSEGDLASSLSTTSVRYGAVVAAATFIYFPELARVLRLVFDVLVDGGQLVFTLLDAPGATAPLPATFHGRALEGCYAHPAEYVYAVASEAGFEVVGVDEVTHEADRLNRPIPGLLVTLRKPARI